MAHLILGNWVFPQIDTDTVTSLVTFMWFLSELRHESALCTNKIETVLLCNYCLKKKKISFSFCPITRANTVYQVCIEKSIVCIPSVYVSLRVLRFLKNFYFEPSLEAKPCVVVLLQFIITWLIESGLWIWKTQNCIRQRIPRKTYDRHSSRQDPGTYRTTIKVMVLCIWFQRK